MLVMYGVSIHCQHSSLPIQCLPRVGVVGSESALFRRLLGWSLALLAIITLLIVLQSTPVGWMVPQS